MLAMNGQPRRVVVLLPNWVGDAVMFTPTLRAIRARFAEAELALFGRPAPVATLTPNPWAGRVIVAGGGLLSAGRRLRREKFDLAVLGPNSFRSALTARLARAKRRLGYDRDGRGWLLTDRLAPAREPDGGFAATSALDYYLKLAEHLGCDVADRRMELSVAEADAAAAEELLAAAGADRSRPIVLLNPGAAYGASKLYPAGRFAAVADGLVEARGAQIVINAAPDERDIARAVAAAMERPALINLGEHENTLGLLKALAARADLMISNDTGPRHFAAAFGVPVVTVFGPTDPRWSDTGYERERIVRVDVPCGPCGKKRCPLGRGPQRDQCMLRISPQMVLAAAEELLRSKESA